jgi:hypothetical protein
MSKLATTTAPRLVKGNDTEVAAELGRLVRDAQDGTRRILVCGLFIEQIAANLKRGQLGPWIEEHEAEIGAKRTQVFAWRDLARNVMEAVGLQKSGMPDFSLPLHEVLTLPPAEVPPEAKEVRTKIDALIAGKSARQLMLNFKTASEEGESVKPARGGNVTPRDKDGKRIAQPKGAGITDEQEAAEHYEAILRNLDTLIAENWHTLLSPDQRTTLAAALSETKRKVDAVK